VNLILLFERDRILGDRFVLSGARAAHVRSVLRAKVGDSLRVGLLEGPLGSGRVASIGDEIESECTFEGEVPPRPAIDLVLAIPRPKSLKKLLPEVTALGIDRLVLLRTWRVAKPYLSTAILDPKAHEPLLHEGMMQAMTTRMPRVQIEPLFKPFVEDRLPSFEGTKLVAHPYAETPLHRIRVAESERIVLVIGPEGGLLPYEIEALERAGCRSIHIGPRILRVETACVALLAQLDLLRSSAD
jgi:RsmE family RNA methyltransferase